MHRLLRPSAYGAAALAAVAAAQCRANRTSPTCDEGQPPARLPPVAAAMSATVRAASLFSNSPSSSARNHREDRFLDFASVEYDSVPYMTPEDFLESVTQERPRQRKARKPLSKSELDQILHKTPLRWWASTKLFRNLGHNGIFSYSEYLFLLCTLANPQSGFAIAFNMIDRSRNQSIDKAEFATLNAMVLRQPSQLETVQIAAIQDTTLMRHFFGKSGKDCLNYHEFSKFMSNLQCEVLEIEFLEFSKGMPTIAESDFAGVLLRYTNLSEATQAQYVQQIKDKLVREEGIGFEDFLLFFQFINSLHDFATALRMYALARHPITQEEFQRAVKACVGYTLAPRVVSTVFLLFDKDGDGSLSSEELLGILRDRLRRLNHKPRSSDTLLGGFKQCLKREIQKD